jgi:uncharacterized protein (DUF697 family)
MVLPGEQFLPSDHPTGHRGDDVGRARALVARLVGVAVVYGSLVVLGMIPLVGFALASAFGLIAGAFVTTYVLFTLRASDYTLYSLRLAVVDAVRTGEWRPR